MFLTWRLHNKTVCCDVIFHFLPLLLLLFSAALEQSSTYWFIDHLLSLESDRGRQVDTSKEKIRCFPLFPAASVNPQSISVFTSNWVKSVWLFSPLFFKTNESAAFQIKIINPWIMWPEPQSAAQRTRSESRGDLKCHVWNPPKRERGLCSHVIVQGLNRASAAA